VNDLLGVAITELRDFRERTLWLPACAARSPSIPHQPHRIRQTACVALSLPLILPGIDFGPLLWLDDCLTTTIMSQPTEINQFIFGRRLKGVRLKDTEN
jgi:hypothetical protein